VISPDPNNKLDWKARSQLYLKSFLEGNWNINLQVVTNPSQELFARLSSSSRTLAYFRLDVVPAFVLP